MTRARAAVVAAAGAVVGAACGQPVEPSPARRIGPAVVEALEAADRVREPWRCAAADGPGLADETLAIDGSTWRASGHTLKLERPGPATIGVVADAGGAAPATLAALGALRGKLAPADVVLVLGGMGATQAEIEATLGALADRATGPLIALPGDLEPTGAQAAAIAALRARGNVVLDGRLIHRIEAGGAAVALVPGGGAAARLVAGDEGCRYRAADAQAAIAGIAGHPGLRIVATAEAPRVAVDGEPAGELVLTAAAAQVDVQLHGPLSGVGAAAASAARNGGRDGAGIALSPGTSDATTRLPDARRGATAGLLAISGATWRWRPISDAAPDAERGRGGP